ncbi:synaptotagmin-like protein 4 [Dysidea avara]|uniref:synaptotagmin-like protein 4 n=1 Tax=Dysidea avara TaxID=196820 RepID=UPI00332211DF
MSQVVHLPLLTEKEGEAILSVIEEDLKLQNEEEKRIQKLHEDIDRISLKYKDYAGTFCAQCGIRFGWILDSGKMCPTCSQWTCKRERVHCSYKTHQWICKLCHIRMKLYISEQMLSVYLYPSNVLVVPFDMIDSEIQQEVHCKQSNLLHYEDETEQDYHNQELFQQATGEESEVDNGDEEDVEEEQEVVVAIDEEEKLQQQQKQQQQPHIHKQSNPTRMFVTYSSSNKQGTQKEKEIVAEQHQKQNSFKEQQSIQEIASTTMTVISTNDYKQMHPKPVTTRTPPQSLNSMVKPNSLKPQPTQLTAISPTPLDDDDIDVTADSEDTLLTSSCDVTRSSPDDDDGETSDEDLKRINYKQPKSILVYPSNNGDGEETINPMFPQKSERKALFELDNDYLTKQNTMKNHVSITSLKSSDGDGSVRSTAVARYL